MKTQLLTYLIALGLGAAANAQFDSGSTGAYGAINVTTADVTLDMPDDGIFHCTTINVNSNRVLYFRKNARNTPVYLLAKGDVTISGYINISGGNGTGSAAGGGGPGGFDGGLPAFGSTPPGAGGGPGGGRGGDSSGNVATTAGGGAFGGVPTGNGSTRVKNGAAYGTTLLVPLIGGSGAGAENGIGGGGGGGAILIASNTRIIVNGEIRSEGGFARNQRYQQGSGGAIRLVAPRVEGTGAFSTLFYGYGGAGRTRIDTLDRSAMSIGGVDSIGNLMFVFPSPLPKLSVINAAGTAIAEGTTTPVNLFLPSGTSANQTITVRARDFGQGVPVRVSLLPDNADPINYDVAIDNTAVNPADATVNVTVPLNVQVRVQVWTR